MKSEKTLELSIDGRVIFTSCGKWLHPLFELERFLSDRRLDLESAEIRDKIIGRGSAFLIIRMGFRRIHAGVLSRLGKEVLDRAGATCTWESLVEVIQCRTEGLLRDTFDSEEAYQVLSALAGEDGGSAREGKATSSSAPGG